MNTFIEFIKEYWFQLLTALAFVVEIIFIFIKRKPKSIDDFKLCLNEALSCVPDLVIDFERPGEGEVKRLQVINCCISGIIHKLGRKLTEQERSLVFNSISEKIETVLCTPTKKEKINEK